MDAEKMRFLFGEDVPEGFNPDDPEDRAALLNAVDVPLEDGRLVLREVIANQIADDDPFEVWATAQRLVGLAVDRGEAMSQLCMVLASVMYRVLDERRTFDASEYAASLGRLPLPSAEDLEGAVVQVARDKLGIEAAELDRVVLEHFGASSDDRLLESLVDRVSDRVMDDEGPLAMLSGDRVVHVGDLTSGIVLTHRLNDSERALEVLTAAFDLAGFARLDDLRTADGEILVFLAEEGHLAWRGPDRWLADHPAGTLLAVRVGTDGLVEVEAVGDEPAMDPELVRRLRAVYDRAVDEAWLPVTGEELVLGLLAEDRSAFSTPRPPLDELCQAAGLERRLDAAAHDETVWATRRQLRRARRVYNALETDAQRAAASRALNAADDPDVTRDELGQVLASLRDPEVLDVVAAELFDPDQPEDSDLHAADAFIDRLLDAAGRPQYLAVARWLAAVAAERSGQVQVADAHLHLAVEADPTWPPAVDRAAWYASDKGDAVTATRLWQRLGATHTEEYRLVAGFAHAGPKVGRNDPCWCGSGRKHKFCHLGQSPTRRLADRVGWLCRKATGYLERRGGQAAADVAELAAARALDSDDPDSLAEAFEDPIVIDTALTEGGWFDRFLAERGALLPDDEALLGQAWTLVERTVYEILEVGDGEGLSVRDLKNGDVVDVTERTFSRQAAIGQLICARAVPDGQGHQFVGSLFPVAPGRERQVLDLLDNGDGEDLCRYVGALHMPPALQTREGEPLVACTATVKVDDPDVARTLLDDRFESEEGGWAEWHPLDDDERILRAQLRLEGSAVTISTHSERRMDRVLDALLPVLSGARLVRDDRQPLAPGELPALSRPLPPLPADAMPEGAVLADIQDRMERRWCDESVPALGGLTPRQAVADPTRIEELERLLATFPLPDDLPAGMITMRPERLRTLLALR